MRPLKTALGSSQGQRLGRIKAIFIVFNARGVCVPYALARAVASSKSDKVL